MLLDGFLSSVAKEKAEVELKERTEKEKATVAPDGPIDSLLSALSSTTAAVDLEERVSLIWRLMDTDNSGC